VAGISVKCDVAATSTHTGRVHRAVALSRARRGTLCSTCRVSSRAAFPPLKSRNGTGEPHLPPSARRGRNARGISSIKNHSTQSFGNLQIDKAAGIRTNAAPRTGCSRQVFAPSNESGKKEIAKEVASDLFAYDHRRRSSIL
jgi:hypothetical protein